MQPHSADTPQKVADVVAVHSPGTDTAAVPSSRNLRAKAISGGVVIVGAQVACSAAYFIAAIVMARLLSPEDFGRVTIATAVIGFGSIFKDAGLSTVTVQRIDLSRAQLANLFWINVAVGFVFTVVLILLAPLVALIYRDPSLQPVTITLATTLLVASLSVQQRALLSRNLRFNMLACIDVTSMAVGAAVGIVSASRGYGYWSLVWMQLSSVAAETLMSWILCGWRPDWPRFGQGTRPLVHFGASVTAGILIRRLTRSVDSLLIGKVFGAAAVGVYSRGLALLTRPLDQFIAPFDGVFVPLLARLQREPERFRRHFLLAYSAIALVSFAMAGMFLALAEPIVLALLGAKWSAVVPVFRAFAPAVVAIPLGYASMWPLTTHARSKDIVHSSLLASIIAIASFIIGLPFGPVGVALAFSLSSLFIRLPFQYQIVARGGVIREGDFWKVFVDHLPLFAVVATACHVSKAWVSDAPPLVQLICGVPAGVLAGIAMTAAVRQRRLEALWFIAAARDAFSTRRHSPR